MTLVGVNTDLVEALFLKRSVFLAMVLAACNKIRSLFEYC